jgi:predicted HTH transcriptional regulator
MYWNRYIEKVGTGTEDIINKCREYGLRTPEFYQEEDFRVVIWRTNEVVNTPECTKGVPEVCQSVPEVCQNVQYSLINIIKSNPSISRNELSKQLKISVRQVRNIIDQLRKEGKLI